MFAVEMLPAGHGDALVIEWGPRGKTKQLLVDAGTFHSWPDVRQRLQKRWRDKYEAFVITHVDEDHIGGAIALLDDRDLRSRISKIWFNGYIHCDAPRAEREGTEETSVLGPVMGEQLTTRIHDGAAKWNPGFEWGPECAHLADRAGGPIMVPDEGDLMVVDLDADTRLTVISPTGPKLERIAKTWKTVVVNAGLEPGAGGPGHNKAPRPHDKNVNRRFRSLNRRKLKDLASRKQSDGSAANGSSIGFIVEHNGKRLLMAGDAHSSVLSSGLKRYGELVGEEVPTIDLVKLSHHGSGANLSSRVLEAMDARRFMISSNSDNFGHPDDSAIAKAILAAEDRQAKPAVFFCNYRSDRTLWWHQRSDGINAEFKLPKQGAAGLRVAV